MSSQHRLSDLLNDAKRASGLSVRALAQRGGLSHGTVENVLKNAPRTHPIPEPTIDKLAKAFGIPSTRLRAAHYADLGLVPEGTGPVADARSARPVGLGLDDAASELTDDDIEDIKALIQAKRARRGLT